MQSYLWGKITLSLAEKSKSFGWVTKIRKALIVVVLLAEILLEIVVINNFVTQLNLDALT